MTDKTPPKDLLDWFGVTNAPDWTRSRWLGGATTVFLALLIGGAYLAAFFLVFGVLFGGKEAGFGTGTIIVALLGAPFLVWSTVIKQKTVEFQKESHITERISKAVEQLGEEKTVKEIVDGETVERTVPNIEVRIGGLLSLERIAQDSTSYDKGRDHVRVMEILCAYVRENAPLSGAKISLREEWERTPKGEEPGVQNISLAEFCADHGIEEHEDAYDYIGVTATTQWAQSLPKPRADIAIALQIIGRRTPEQRQAEARWGPDAAPDAEWVFDRDCPELPDAQDDQPHGNDALDAYANQLKAWKTHIGTYRGYRLDLRGTNLQAADLSRLILSGAHLIGARMEGVNLSGARMEGANLQGARMEGADLSRARMEGADLSEAWMEGAALEEARMEGAVLREAHMEGVLFWKARMDANTSLTGAALRGAAIKDVNWESVPMTADQLNATFGDASVTRPKDIDKPDHWPDWELPTNGERTFDDELKKWRANPDTYTPPEKPQDP